jgi:hypothetical protein
MKRIVPKELIVEMTEYFVKSYNLRQVKGKDPEWEDHIKNELPDINCETEVYSRDFAAEFIALISCYEFNPDCIDEFDKRCDDEYWRIKTFFD